MHLKTLSKVTEIIYKYKIKFHSITVMCINPDILKQCIINLSYVSLLAHDFFKERDLKGV